MRVGIVSIYDNGNIGNKLQNYALQSVLGQYAEEVLTIKNRPILKNLLRYWKCHSGLAESFFWNRLTGNDRKVELLSFDKAHIVSSKYFYYHNLPKVFVRKQDQCDIYCAGSDQNWNPYFGRKESFNYLGFVDSSRTFSYAASFGIDQIPSQYRESVRTGLQHIRYLSVREEAGKRIVEELTGRTDIQVLVDPTMLLTTQEWDRVAQKPKAELPEKYILTYFLGTVSSERRAVINRRAEDLGCALVELMDPNSPFYAIGPGAFVYLIKHATAVCTDSFHASVFSFLYERPLAILSRQDKAGNMSSRLDTLVNKFSLQNCIVNGDMLSELPARADYSAGYAALATEREKSKVFLDRVFDRTGA